MASLGRFAKPLYGLIPDGRQLELPGERIVDAGQIPVPGVRIPPLRQRFGSPLQCFSVPPRVLGRFLSNTQPPEEFAKFEHPCPAHSSDVGEISMAHRMAWLTKVDGLWTNRRPVFGGRSHNLLTKRVHHEGRAPGRTPGAGRPRCPGRQPERRGEALERAVHPCAETLN